MHAFMYLEWKFLRIKSYIKFKNILYVYSQPEVYIKKSQSFWRYKENLLCIIMALNFLINNQVKLIFFTFNKFVDFSEYV